MIAMPLIEFDRIPYRVGEFFRAVTAKPDPEMARIASKYLSPSLLELFERMSPYDQAHCVAVMNRLLDSGEEDPDLLAAALLHDVGKSKIKLSVWYRVAAVLLREKLRFFACKTPGKPLCYSVYIQVEHPRIGAEMAKQAGCSDRCARLILYHQEKNPPLEPEERRMVSVLQQADKEL